MSRIDEAPGSGWNTLRVRVDSYLYGYYVPGTVLGAS